MPNSIHLLVVEERFYDHLSTELLQGSAAILEGANAVFDVITVPGVLEIPAAISMVVSASGNNSIKYNGFIALGVVIRGQTSHFDIVVRESVHGLMKLSIEKSLAIGNGILVVDNEEQAWTRVNRSQLNRGGFAARAAVEMVKLKQRFCQ